MSEMISADEPVLIPVIADDGSLYPVEKLEAHRRGLLHLAISVFVFSPRGELLIQQRAASKYHSPGQWANTCCSHPHMGEDVAECAHRRMQDELGVTIPLSPGGVLTYRADVGGGLIEHERVHLFLATVDPARLALKPNPHEVQATRWITLDALDSAMANRPEDFTPWFRIYVRQWRDLWAPAA